ncbi:MFS transporter [Sulfurifustis variabilis]|uniref:MFS transporter n=1 Tax=Sulfurifustis variabilis TaxID=1675686 RepID=A0A1B4V5X0_9GAMM|nr:MFS transporter [Sulfurifustis variabilis]BAU48953.1 MFS transporter [Sulfurifustis variabilis]
MTRRYSTDPRTERSLRHAVRDGAAYSVMAGAGETYFSAYALFLGASAAQVSLLAAVPPLFGALAQVLAAWLSLRLGRRRTVILTGALMHALTWFPLVWLPYFFPAHAVPVMITCLIFYHGWIGLGTPLWGSLIGDLVPAQRRGRFFAARTRLMSVANLVALVAAGLVLHLFELREDTRLGFILIFTLAAVARLFSLHELWRMHEPDQAPGSFSLPPLSHLVPRLMASRFLHFSLFTASFSFAVAVAAPFFTVYMLKDLEFSYLQFMLSTAATVLTQALTLRTWGRFSDVFGNRLVLLVAGALVPLLPALWLVSDSFGYILLVQALGGLAWAGFGLAAGNYLYDLVPPERRTAYWAGHNVLNSAGAFGGAVLGGYLSARMPHAVYVLGAKLHWSSGLWAVLLVSAMLRGLVAASFLPRLREVRPVPHLDARAAAFRLIRFAPLGGLVLDLLGWGRARRRPPRLARPDTEKF